MLPSPGSAPSAGDPMVQQPEMAQPTAEPIVISEIGVSSPKAGGERERQAQDSAERLSDPNQSCRLCSYRLLTSAVNLLRLQKPGNICRCWQQSAALDLSHPLN